MTIPMLLLPDSEGQNSCIVAVQKLLHVLWRLNPIDNVGILRILIKNMIKMSSLTINVN